MRTPPHRRWFEFTLATLFALIAISAIVKWVYINYGHISEFELLLAGDSHVQIKSFRLVGHGRDIDLSDPATLQYLTNSIRNASKDSIGEHGYTYYAYIVMGQEASVLASCDAPENADGFNIGFPYYDADPTVYWVSFSQPIPQELMEAIRQMRDSSQ